jgi:hypothetical protein
MKPQEIMLSEKNRHQQANPSCPLACVDVEKRLDLTSLFLMILFFSFQLNLPVH